MLGCQVFTIGFPKTSIMGKNPKVTNGIISALSGIYDDPRMLQTTVAIQSGNSGGPLVNMEGEVVGIVTGKLSAVKMFKWTGDLPQNVNYAIKVSYISSMLSSIPPARSNVHVLPVKKASLAKLAARIRTSVMIVVAE